MLIAKVMGTAVASAKHQGLKSGKLLLLCKADPEGKTEGNPFLALDLVGAGENELVAVASGSAARWATGHRDAPVDKAVIGILDSLMFGSEVTFRKD
jgi:ethanolamine utilization protein EutN